MKHFKEFALGLFILGAALLLGYMSITIGKVQFGDTLKVEAVFKNATGVVKDAPVMLAGIEVGHVEEMQVINNGNALMKLVIEPNIEVYKDARAEIRSKSLLGEKYIALIPGTAGTQKLADGERITDTMTPVDLDEVLNHLAPVLTKLDPEDLNTLIHTLAVSVKGREADMGKLISGAADLLEVVQENKAGISRMIKNLDGTAAKANVLLARNGPALESMIQNLNVVSHQLRTDAPLLVKNINLVTEDVRGLTGPFRENAGQLSQNLNKIANSAVNLTNELDKHPEMVKNLNATLSELPPLLQKAPDTLDRLPAMFDLLTPVLTGADQVITQLNPVLEETNKLLKDEKIKESLKKIEKEGIKVRVENGIQIRLW